MEKIRYGIGKLALEELVRANGMHPMFHSNHEGYGVLLEEIEEVEGALRLLKAYNIGLWDKVKGDHEITLEYLDTMGTKAMHVACESIQVVAMIQKFKDSLEEKVYE